MELTFEQQTKDKTLRLVKAFIEASQYVLLMRPNAHVIYTFDKKGEQMHFAVYDCKLRLNEKGNFDKEQPAPQRLGDLIPCKQLFAEDIIGTQLHVGAWCSAADDLRRLTMRLSAVADLQNGSAS